MRKNMLSLKERTVIASRRIIKASKIHSDRRKQMGKVILGLTISLDGFAEDGNGSVNPLYADLDLLKETEVMRESILTTGAVVMSKKEFEMAEDPDWVVDYEYQVPIFVFTDKAPEKHPKETDKVSITFVTTGVDDAILQAKAAAGDKDVNIIGSALTTQLCLRTGLADELHVDIIPLFLKTGFRPFESLDDRDIKLERVQLVGLPAGRTHIRYKIVKENDSLLEQLEVGEKSAKEPG
jgi:dihydrofolate reductase